MPGVAYSAQNLNPISQQMLQMLTGMILTESEEEATDLRKAILTDIQDLRYSWSNVMNGVRAYLAFRAKTSLDEIDLYLEDTARLIEKLRGYDYDLTLDQADALEQFAERREAFIKHLETTKELHGGDKWRTDAYLIREEVGPIVAGIQNELNQLVKEQQRLTEQTSQSLLGQVERSTAVVTTLLVIGLVLGVGVMVASGIVLVKPVVNMREILKDMSEGEGDLTRRCKMTSSDELGQAARYFNQMLDTLQGMVKEIATVSHEVNGRSAQANSEIDYVTNNVAEGAERAQGTAAGTEEMAATSVEIARIAQEAAEEADKARDEAEAGTRSVAEMTEKARAMSEQIQRLHQDVDVLSEKGKNMLQMVSIISEIAGQTNLLALNAAIEAARAGEMGRGFAVVADEVRQLASKTQDSTDKITALINENMQANEGLVGIMETVSGANDSVQESIDATATVIDHMTNSVGVMNDRVTQIADAAREQSTATEEIALNVEAISSMESDNAGRMQQASGHIQEVTELSSRLDTLVGRFKV
jgi:methyl-accepting chemotaxis protein